MPVSAISPNVDNLGILKGYMKFWKTGDSDYRHMGNCPEIEFTPTLEKKEHFSSMAGTRKKDRVVVLEQSGTLRIVMEEMTPENLAIITMSTVTPSSPEYVLDLMSVSEITGKGRFVGQNDVGVRIQIDFYNLSFSPSGSLNLIGEDWAAMEVTADVLTDSNGEFGQILWNITSEVETITA
jgi:hypothetical protein